MIVLLFVLGAAVFVAAWYELAGRSESLRNFQRQCNHVWGEVEEVGRNQPARFGRFFIRRCLACREQMNCNADGSKYVPLKERRDDE